MSTNSGQFGEVSWTPRTTFHWAPTFDHGFDYKVFEENYYLEAAVELNDDDNYDDVEVFDQRGFVRSNRAEGSESWPNFFWG